jgi:hypothetical protein
MDVAKEKNAPTGEADGKVDKITALQDAIGKILNCRASISHHSLAKNKLNLIPSFCLHRWVSLNKTKPPRGPSKEKQVYLTMPFAFILVCH